ncbi:hypothetical protein DFQ26_006782 [Actinomortierella ambigua]|nr:hypothetical protein DFQ26_006782 [Actinomortierella ambigua]
MNTTTPTTTAKSWGWNSLRRKNVSCHGDMQSSSLSREEHLYDEEAQQQQQPSGGSLAPSPTLYSPRSPFTPKTLSLDDQQQMPQHQQKYNSIRSTFSSISSPAVATAVNTPSFTSASQRVKERSSPKVYGAGVASSSEDSLTRYGTPGRGGGGGGGRASSLSQMTMPPSEGPKYSKKPKSMLFKSSQLPDEAENGKKYIKPNHRKKKRKDAFKEAFKMKKTLFSNERTFIHWLKFGMLLGALAMTLLNFSTLSADATIATSGGGGLDAFGVGGGAGHAPPPPSKMMPLQHSAVVMMPQNATMNSTSSPPPVINPEFIAMAKLLGKVGQYVGAFLLLVCMGCLAYSTAVFHWRHIGVEKNVMDKRYYDRWGPTVLTVLLITVYTVNVYPTSGLGSKYQPTPFYNIHPIIDPPSPTNNQPVPTHTPNSNTTDPDDDTGDDDDADWMDPSSPSSWSDPTDPATTTAGAPASGGTSSQPSSSYDDTGYGYGDDDEDEEEEDDEEDEE